jgi:hypothetical protein
MEGRDVGVRGEREWLVRCNWSGEGDAEIIQGRGGGYAGMRAFVGHQLRGGGGGGGVCSKQKQWWWREHS